MGSKKLIVLVGSSGSGKTHTLKLLEKEGYKKLVTTTTRPPREGEVDGVDYIFMPREHFTHKNMLEVEEINGELYGMNIDVINQIMKNHDKLVIVVNYNGVKKLCDYIRKNNLAGSYLDTTIIHLDVPKNIRFNRIVKELLGEENKLMKTLLGKEAIGDDKNVILHTLKDYEVIDKAITRMNRDNNHCPLDEIKASAIGLKKTEVYEYVYDSEVSVIDFINSKGISCVVNNKEARENDFYANIAIMNNNFSTNEILKDIYRLQSKNTVESINVTRRWLGLKKLESVTGYPDTIHTVYSHRRNKVFLKDVDNLTSSERNKLRYNPLINPLKYLKKSTEKTISISTHHNTSSYELIDKNKKYTLLIVLETHFLQYDVVINKFLDAIDRFIKDNNINIENIFYVSR